jgi:hypothetical protein
MKAFLLVRGSVVYEMLSNVSGTHQTTANTHHPIEGPASQFLESKHVLTNMAFSIGIYGATLIIRYFAIPSRYISHFK